MAQQRTDGRGARLFVALVVVMSLGAALLSTAATPAAAEATGAGPTEATVNDEVTAAIADEGHAFVIANLRAPAGSPAAVGSVAQSVIDDLPEGSFEGQATAQPQPFVALKVDAEGLAALAGNPDVSSVVVNHMNTVDLVNSVPAAGADVTRSLGIDGTGGVVAVLDTGVDRTHPFLSDTGGNSRVLVEACFSGAGDTYSNVYSMCPSGDAQETGTGAAAPCPILPACTHGTHVAGIAAGGHAANNGTSVPKYGVSPAASLVAAQVFSAYCSVVPLANGTCLPGWQAVAFDSDIALAMVWVHDVTSLYGVDAVNLSVGGSSRSATACDSQTIVSAYVNLLRADGVATVIASGNDGAKNGISTPACISTAISVGSYDIGTSSVSSFSNSAANLTMLAPGARTVGGTRMGIVSSLPDGLYGGKEGTSMATPHVAGAIAQLRQGRPSVTVDQIVSLLTSNGTSVNDTNGVVKPLLRVDKSGLEAPSLSFFGLDSLDTVGHPIGVTPILHGIPTPTPGFQWYRCTTASDGAVALPGGCVAIVGATTDHYTPVLADLGKYLTVRLTATNGVAPTLTSNRSSGLITNVPVMSGPPFVEAGNGSVHMIYAVSTSGGSPITGYEIRLQPLGAPASPIVIQVGAITDYTATGLTNGTAYSITVAGKNANGAGPPSAAAQATPFTIPDAPTAVVAAPGDTAATVTWSAPAFDGGAPAIGRYEVTSSPGGKTCSWVIDLPPIGAPPTPQPLGCTVTGLNNNTAYTFTVRAQNMAGYGPESAPSTPVTPVAGYHSLVPARLMDTRADGDTIDDLYKATGAIGPGKTRDLPVLGRGGVPASGVAAVALNVTVVGPSSGGYLTVYPKGVSTPNASNLNFSTGQIIPNMVIVQVGTGGNVTFSNPFGNTPVIADVVGYFPSGAAYNPMVPARLMDTRLAPGGATIDDESEGEGSIPAGQTRDLTVVGRAGIPASGVGAVVLNITVAGSDSAGFLTAYPKGVTAPNASNLNFTAGQVIPNMAIVKVGDGGQITIKNPYGNTPVIVDVVGWFPTGTVYNPLVPARLMDTRVGPGVTTVDSQYVGTGMMGAGQTRTLKVTGRGGVPDLGVGTVALNVTVTGPTGNGYLTVYPTGVSPPAASNLNYVTGQTIPNMVIVKVGPDGTISINGQYGATNVIVDVVGWFP